MLPVDTTWQHVERTFIATGTEADGRLTLHFGAETPTVLLADVVFEHVAAGTPGPSPSPPSPAPPASNGPPGSGGGGGGGCSLGRTAQGNSWSGAVALALVAFALCRARRYRV